MERLLIAKGRGVATNVPENELIKLVRIRPLLYDKKAGDYRKVKIEIKDLKISQNLQF